MRNKYPGNCCICNKHVPAGKGYFERGRAGRWLVRCENCCGKGAPYKQKCHKCGKKLFPGEGHYEHTKEDEGGGWYSTIWKAYCDKCKNNVSDKEVSDE